MWNGPCRVKSFPPNIQYTVDVWPVFFAKPVPESRPFRPRKRKLPASSKLIDFQGAVLHSLFSRRIVNKTHGLSENEKPMKPFIPRRLAISHHAAWQVIHVRLLKRALRQVLYSHGFSPYFVLILIGNTGIAVKVTSYKDLLIRIVVMIRFPTVIYTGFGQPQSQKSWQKNGAGNAFQKKGPCGCKFEEITFSELTFFWKYGTKFANLGAKGVMKKKV